MTHCSTPRKNDGTYLLTYLFSYLLAYILITRKTFCETQTLT